MEPTGVADAINTELTDEQKRRLREVDRLEEIHLGVLARWNEEHPESQFEPPENVGTLALLNGLSAALREAGVLTPEQIFVGRREAHVSILGKFAEQVAEARRQVMGLVTAAALPADLPPPPQGNRAERRRAARGR